MIPSHKIKNAVFDMRFNSKTALLQESAALGGFVEQRLMAVVDDVFSGHALRDHVIYVDKLKIDLGHLPLGDYKRQMEKRLRSKLEALLKSKIQRLNHTESLQERVIPYTRHNLEVIEYFLISGSVPGHLNLKSEGSLEQRLQSVLQHERAGFLRFLKTDPHRPQIIRRLVRQLPAGMVIQVVRLLAPVQAVTAIGAVETILGKQRGRFSTGSQFRAFTELVWASLLDYFLEYSKNRFSVTEFADRVKKEFATHSAPTTDAQLTAFIGAVRDELAQRRPAEPHFPPTHTISSEIEGERAGEAHNFDGTGRFHPQENRTASEMLKRAVTQTASDEMATLSGYLRRDRIAMPVSDATARALLTHLIQQDYSPLYAVLRDILADTGAVKKMIALLPDEWLTRVLAGLQPDLHVPVQTYADVVADACDPRRWYDGPEKVNALKWEFIFSYTSQSAGQPFQQHDFIRRCVAFLAANARRVDPKTFTGALARRLTNTVKSSSRPEHLAVLRALDHPAVATGDSVKSTLTDKRTVDGMTALIDYLRGDRTSPPVSEITAKALLTRLTHQDYAPLYDMLRDTLTDAGAANKIIALLSHTGLTRILAGLWPDLHVPVLIYADVIADACDSNTGFERPGKIDALKWEFIFSYASQLTGKPFQQRDFIRRFVAFLVDNARHMDQESFTNALSRSLADTIKSSGRPEHLAVLGELGHPADATDDLVKSTLTDERASDEMSALIGYLSSDRSAPPVSDATAKAIFIRLIRQDYAPLSSVLRDTLTDAGAVKKMIALLSHDGLTRILAGLWPDLHVPVLTYADVIAGACDSKTGFDRPGKIDALKWEFIFSYASRPAGQPFQQRDFIRRLVAFLADNARHMDQESFTDTLSQRLAATVESSGRPEHLAVLGELGHPAVATGDPVKSALTDERAAEEMSTLIGYLSGDRSAPPVSDATAKAEITRLIRRDYPPLYPILRETIRSGSAVMKIIALLSHEWLTRILAGLRPDLHVLIRTYADLIADACDSKTEFGRPGKVDALKWEFIFSYASQTAEQPFQQHDFIRRFVVFLADNARHMDQKAFDSALLQRLTAKSKSSTRPEYLTIIQILGSSTICVLGF